MSVLSVGNMLMIMSDAQKIDDLTEALKAAIETIERCGCQFFACDGPDKPFVDMATCHACATIQDFRKLLREIKR